MKVEILGSGEYRYQLKLVEGLASGIQPHEDGLRDEADETIMISKLFLVVREITH